MFCTVRLGQKSTFSGMIGHYTESEKEKAFSILSELGLADQAYKRCDALSGGQKQRVGIARANHAGAETDSL